MSAQLSKMHVRFIQSQKNFFLSRAKETNSVRLPLSQLYVKDNEHFYLINQDTPIPEDQTVTLTFKEPTPALDSLSCTTDIQEMKNDTEAYEDALLFFNAEPHDVNQLLLLTLKEVK